GRPAAGRVVGQADLDQAADRTLRPAHRGTQRAYQPDPVDRMHETRVPRHAGGLVRLELANEVPRQVQIRAGHCLRGRLGVAVLPHVGHAQLGQQSHVAGGPCLGDGDQRYVRRGPAGGGARGVDALAHLRQVAGQLSAAVRRVPHLRKSGISRSSSSSKTTGRRRLVATSKVLPAVSTADRLTGPAALAVTACSAPDRPASAEASGAGSSATGSGTGAPSTTGYAPAGPYASSSSVATSSATGAAGWATAGSGWTAGPLDAAGLTAAGAGSATMPALMPCWPVPLAPGAGDPPAGGPNDPGRAIGWATGATGATGGAGVTGGASGARAAGADAVAPPMLFRASSKPAAITVTRTSSPRASSMTAPKMMVASGAAELATSWAASLISNSPRSEPPWMDSSTPCAPSMLASSSGLEIAISAAATLRSSPRAEPMPMSADPAPDMTDFTSAKSRLMRPGVVMRSVMPCTPDSSTWSAALKASSTLTCRSEMDSSRSFGMTMSVSTSSRSRSMPASACAPRRLPSKPNGRVTTPIVSAPRDLATLATTGAPPVPVPPPSPAVTKTMSAPLRTSSISSR